MKLHDILTPPEQLDEMNLKQAAAAGLIGISALAPHPAVGHDKAARPAVVQQADSKDQQKMIASIISRYGLEPTVARRIVKTAHKYEHDDFPTAEDILSIIGVESKFKSAAKSKLRRDPAVGLMQIRPGVWKIPPGELLSVESNIKHGATILRSYYQKLNNEEAALQAYNVGITAFRKGKTNPHYVRKVQAERSYYEPSLASPF